ncbi:hypothetical protein OS176_12005 [Xanthomonadaceae bacterium XH05]|nr:hypothetical protein [Xanthomonadaceae bacterium XH05]
MKKALGGCLVVALLLAVVGGAAGWWFLVRPAWNAGSQFLGAANQLAELAQLDSQVRNRSAFTPPADGRIPDASLARFLATQQSIQQRIGPTLATLESRYRQIEQDARANGEKPGVTEALSAYGDLFSMVREAKLAQVEALNAHDVSLEEYRWVRMQTYSALASGALSADMTRADTALAANAQRLQPHREMLTRTAVVAWLGL